MRVIGVLFLLMFVVVGVGFYFQATHDWRSHSRLEPAATMRFHAGEDVKLKAPLAVCETGPIAIEARRMTLRMTANKPKPGDIRIGNAWFAEMKPHVKMADEVVVVVAEPNLSKVRIASGPDKGYEGFVFTVGLEEAAGAAVEDKSTK